MLLVMLNKKRVVKPKNMKRAILVGMSSLKKMNRLMKAKTPVTNQKKLIRRSRRISQWRRNPKLNRNQRRADLNQQKQNLKNQTMMPILILVKALITCWYLLVSTRKKKNHLGMRVLELSVTQENITW